MSGLQNIFYTSSGQQCTVTMDRDGLYWNDDVPQAVEHFVPTTKIVSCWLCHKGRTKCCSPLGIDTSSVATHNTNLAATQHRNYSVTHNQPDISSLNRNTRDCTVLQIERVNDSDTLPHSISTSTNSTLFNSQYPNHVEQLVTIDQDDSICSSGSEINTSAEITDDAPNVLAPAAASADTIPVSKTARMVCRHRSPIYVPALCIEYCSRVQPRGVTAACSRGSYNENDDVVVTDWKTEVIYFHHGNSSDIIYEWHDSIWRSIKSLTSRPQHLVVIINPMGGRKKAVSIYMKKVAPLLHRAAIVTTVHQTRHAGHGKVLTLEATSTDGVDGVVVVGGDGIVAEAANGLMLAAARRQHINVNDADANYPPSDIRLGVIPAGSTDAYIHSLNGTVDVVTAALHVIMGSQRSIDIASLHHNNKLDRFIMSGVHMGILGGCQETASKLKNLGPIRDVVSSTYEFMRNRSYECSIKALVPSYPAATPLDEQCCHASCTVCSSPGTGDQEGTWKEVQGEFTMIAACLVSLQNKYSKYGVSPAAHLGDGMIDLVLMPKTTQCTLIPQFVRLGVQKDHLNNSSVNVLRASEIHIEDVDYDTPLNYDGELVYQSHFVMKAHRQCLQTFSRGKELLTDVEKLQSTSNKNGFTFA